MVDVDEESQLTTSFDSDGGVDSNDSNFVFQGSEFESENFNAATFFLKYKAVYNCKFYWTLGFKCIFNSELMSLLYSAGSDVLGAKAVSRWAE